MRARSCAGQAAIEYVAVIAVAAVLLVVAAPAVGAPDVGRALVGAVKHGICLVDGDICTREDARRAGLAPCPLRSDTSGGEATVAAFSIEVGGSGLLTVTPNSDGSVSVVRTLAGDLGVSGGFGGSAGLGPVAFDVSATGAVRSRVQAARGWSFADERSARPFLERAVRNTFDAKRFPPAWTSSESGSSIGGAAGVHVGGDSGSAGVLGIEAAAASAIGERRSRDGTRTTYSRISLDGPTLKLPLLAPKTRGSDEWIAEYTTAADGPRELALRTATRTGSGVVETIARLDLRDPANLAVARPLLESAAPWSVVGGPGKQAVLDRIATHGTIEQLTSTIDDDSVGGSVKVKLGIAFGIDARRVSIHKTLTRATVTRGALHGTRLDCTPHPH